MMSPYSIRAIVELYTTESGGRTQPLPLSSFRCPAEINGELFDCLIDLRAVGRLAPGMSAEVDIRFFLPEVVSGILRVGDEFHLWEKRRIGTVRVVRTTLMADIYWKLVEECLHELSDRSMQERLWLSDGSSGEVSSFVEACCGLFDDSALGHYLDRKSPELEVPVIVAFRELELHLQKVETYRHPQKIMDDPHMQKVRELAGAALRMIRQQKGGD